jgi:hypothetical protein
MADEPRAEESPQGPQTSPLVLWSVAAGILGVFICVAVIGGVVAFKLLDRPAAPPAPVALVINLPDEFRPAASAFYRDLARVIDLGVVATKDDFREAHSIATRVLDVASGDPDLSGASEAISQFLLTRLGAETGPLDAPKTSQALRDLAEAIGG